MASKLSEEKKKTSSNKTNVSILNVPTDQTKHTPAGHESRLHRACINHLVEYLPPKPGETDEEGRHRKKRMKRACDAARKRQTRSKETEEQKLERNKKNRERMAHARKRAKTETYTAEDQERQKDHNNQRRIKDTIRKKEEMVEEKR